MTTGVPWTAEQNRLLRKLLGEKLKSREIAAEINRRTGSHFTGNGVIGRAHRARTKLDAPPEPKPARWKPGRLLMRLGWLDGAFR